MSILPKISHKPIVGLSLMAAMVFTAVQFAEAQPPKKKAKKGPEPEFSVRVELPKGATKGTLIIDARIPKTFHIYSTRTSDNVNPNGRATTFKVDGATWELLGDDFVADHKPHATTEDGLEEKPDNVEHFENKVTWTREIKLKSGVAPESAALSGTLSCQMCDNRKCQQFKKPLKAQVKIIQ